LHGNILNLSENIAKVLGGGYFFDSHCSSALKKLARSVDGDGIMRCLGPGKMIYCRQISHDRGV